MHMIECADTETARLLALDPKLKSLCLPAGERTWSSASRTKWP